MIAHLDDRIAQFTRHAQAHWPAEACALLLNSGELLPVKNLAPDPRLNFNVGRALAIGAFRLGLAAVFHSHIGRCAPSKADRRAAAATGVPWVIVCLDADSGADTATEILE